MQVRSKEERTCVVERERERSESGMKKRFHQHERYIEYGCIAMRVLCTWAWGRWSERSDAIGPRHRKSRTDRFMDR